MRVACVSNFNDEMYEESFVTLAIDERKAICIARVLNSEFGAARSYHSLCYYRVVEDDYKLYKWEP
jgi:hypothetical protein